MEKMNLSQRVVNFDPNDKNTLNFTRLVDLSQCQEKRRHQVFLRTLRAMFLIACQKPDAWSCTYSKLLSRSGDWLTHSNRCGFMKPGPWRPPRPQCADKAREPSLKPVYMWWWTAGAAAGLFLILSCDKGFQRVKCLYKAKVKHLSAAKSSQYESHWYGNINPCPPKALRTRGWLPALCLWMKVGNWK